MKIKFKKRLWNKVRKHILDNPNQFDWELLTGKMRCISGWICHFAGIKYAYTLDAFDALVSTRSADTSEIYDDFDYNVSYGFMRGNGKSNLVAVKAMDTFYKKWKHKFS